MDNKADAGNIISKKMIKIDKKSDCKSIYKNLEQLNKTSQRNIAKIKKK